MEILTKVTKIGGAALERTGITKIKLPDSLKVIERWAFESSKLEEVEVNVGNIKDHTFCSCKDLVRVVLKEGVTKVDLEAFDGCTNISTFIWQDSVKEVGHSVFKGCDKLHEVRTIHNTTRRKNRKFLKEKLPF